MNVLHVTPYFTPAWAYGGVAADVSELARAQVALGHRVTVLTTDALAPHERLPTADTFIDAVRVVRVRNLSGAIRTWLHLSTPVGMRGRARTIVAEHALDIVHLHECAPWKMCAWLACVPHTVPVIVSPHGTLGATADTRGQRRHGTGRSAIGCSRG